MVVMRWCVMPEVLYVQSLPTKGAIPLILELFCRLRLLGPDPVHLKLRRLHLELH